MLVLRFVIANLDHYRAHFICYLLAAFVDGVVAFLIPVCLSEFTKQELSFERFLALVPLLIGCFAASLVMQWILRRYGEALSQKYGHHLRLKYFKIVEHLPVSVLTQHHSGYLLSLVSQVSSGASGLVGTMIWLLAHSFATLSLFLIFTARESVSIAVFNVVMLLLFLQISFLLSKKIVPIAKELNYRNAALMERFVDMMSNLFTIKKLGIYGFAEKQIESGMVENFEQIDELQSFHAGRWFALHSIYGVAFLSTISFLLYQISQEELSASVLILFISAFAVLRGHVERLSEFIKDILAFDAYRTSLEEIIEHAEAALSDRAVTFEALSISDISFRYPDSEAQIAIPSFELSAGEVVCICGESGQGKSTFLNLLARFLDPDDGEAVLNGNLFSSYSREDFRALMSLVSQEVELFNMSVRDNICLGRDLPDEKLVEMFRALRLEQWYDELPEGLDSLVGEKGIRLSAGQKQRLNIARGLLLDRQILIFDEPTSHLDAETEKCVVEYLKRALTGRTAVFVTHRPMIEELCNRTYVFQDRKLLLKK